MPVRLKAHRVVIAIVLERAELPDPIDDASTDRSPLEFAVGFADRVFAMAVADAMLRQQLIVVGIRRVAGECGGVAGIPVEHEIVLGNFGQQCGGLFAAARVAGHLVFEQQNQIVPGAGSRGLAQLIVDGGAIGLWIFEPPEIEAANAIGIERLA